MPDVVVVDGVRSPIGKFGGGLSTVRPDDLLADVYKALAARANLDPALIDEVYAGCGNQAGEDNRDVARMAALLAGFPKEVPGVTVNRNCASALDAVNAAARAIAIGEGSVYFGSGVECMSRAPFVMGKPERVPTNKAPKLWDTTVGWRFNNPKMDAMYPIISLGETAENIAQEMQITREEQDGFALESHRRAIAAMNGGKFAEEIAPISVPSRRGNPTIVDTDEHVRARQEGDVHVLDTDEDDLARLRPAFTKDGSVTAGNSSGINDGAAALLLMSSDRAEELKMKPKLRWLGAASAGVDPGVMGYGPVPATEKLLKRFGLSIDDIDLIELNEAFAAQTIGCMRKLGIDHDKLNVNGGAIALGHPTGASGTRIVVTLMHEMERRAAAGEPVKYGLATLCVGVGMGVATLFEWIGE